SHPGARRPLDVCITLQAASGGDPGLRRRRPRHDRKIPAATDGAAGEAALVVVPAEAGACRAGFIRPAPRANEFAPTFLVSRDDNLMRFRLESRHAELPEQERERIGALFVLRLLGRAEAVSCIEVDAQQNGLAAGGCCL